MAITNGYATLAQVKERLQDLHVYTANTLSFAADTKHISDSAYGLKRYLEGQIIQVSGSASNDGHYTVATGNQAGYVVVNESLLDESAGEEVTVALADPTDDAMLEAVIEAASRAIDNLCGRRFYAATETRYYTAKDGRSVLVDDLLSVTTLKVDTNGDGTHDTTWDSGDYVLMPRNATPYRWIRRAHDGSNWFSLAEDGIEIAGSWGYASTTPTPIQEACVLLSMQLAARQDALFGVAGPAGFEHRINHAISSDPHLMALLTPYMKRWS
jgi:hypothetical protein